MILTSLRLLIIAGFMVASSLAAKEELPESTADGLVLQKDTEAFAVYAKPGASLQEYKRVKLVDAYVAFKKNWQRDYNRTRAGLGEDVRDKDIERIKASVAEEFSRVFTDVLTEGGYEVTDETGPDVLLVRPAIINLDITAPDLNTPGMHATIISSAGSLSLYVELYDSMTSDKIAMALDNKADRERHGFGIRANKTTNKQALDRALRQWAGQLVDTLDEAHGKSE